MIYLSRYIIDDFLDNEKFITKKQKEAYIKEGRFEGNSKKSIKKAFERYYTSFEWGRKKKGQPMYFELGEKRNIPISNDKRTSVQTTEITEICIKAIKSVLTEESKKETQEYQESDNGFINYNFKNNLGRLALTPMGWFVASGLIEDDFRKFCNNHYDSDPTKSDKYWTEKYYAELKSKRIREEFRKIKRKFHFIKIPVLVYEDQSPVLMGIRDNAILEMFLKELDKNPLCEKPRPFRNITNKAKTYNDLLGKYLKERFGTDKMYYVYQLKIRDYGVEKISNDDIEKFRSIIKDSTDRKMLEHQSAISIEYAANCLARMEVLEYHGNPDIDKTIDNISSKPLSRIVSERGVFPTFISLDKELGFGDTSKENIEYFIRDDKMFKSNVDKRLVEIEHETEEYGSMNYKMEDFFN